MNIRLAITVFCLLGINMAQSMYRVHAFQDLKKGVQEAHVQPSFEWETTDNQRHERKKNEHWAYEVRIPILDQQSCGEKPTAAAHCIIS